MATALDASVDTLDDAERAFVANIREHGWFRTSVFAEADKPGFSFTTGFFVTQKMPEIVIFSMKDEFAHTVFWNIFNDAADGVMLPVGIRTDEVFSNNPAYLFQIDKSKYQEYLGWSQWFYGNDDFPSLQLVWSDRAGNFPWEDGFDETFREDQPDLTEKGWLASIVG